LETFYTYGFTFLGTLSLWALHSCRALAVRGEINQISNAKRYI